MQSEELRIGNYVKAEGHVTKITGILHYDVYTRSGTYGVVYLEPIPLTEELFLKFGFEKCDKLNYSGLWKKGGNNFFDFDKYSPWVILYKFDVDLVRVASIKHVHQLQNIYYSITGEEITLK